MPSPVHWLAASSLSVCQALCFGLGALCFGPRPCPLTQRFLLTDPSTYLSTSPDKLLLLTTPHLNTSPHPTLFIVEVPSLREGRESRYLRFLFFFVSFSFLLLLSGSLHSPPRTGDPNPNPNSPKPCLRDRLIVRYPLDPKNGRLGWFGSIGRVSRLNTLP